jgi:hypothetical protein
MIIPVPQLPEKHRDFDPTETKVALIKPTKQKSNLDINEGEMLIMLDTEKERMVLSRSNSKMPAQGGGELLFHLGSAVGKVRSIEHD